MKVKDPLIVRFNNLKLDEIVSPINVDKYEYYLKRTGYNTEKTRYLVDGFKCGFDLGYVGPEERQDKSSNIPIRIGSKTILWNKVMAEVKERRYSGPFAEIPLDSYVQSPLGLVPKGIDKTRLIFHLSYDFENFKSINYYTPEDFCSVRYNDLDSAVKMTLNLGPGPIFYSKTDYSNAFRVVPLNIRSRRWTWMGAEDPKSGKKWYFQDNCLPFGSSASCSIFQDFSDSIKHIVNYLYGGSAGGEHITNYLDDFLFIERSEKVCNELVDLFLRICVDINIPVAHEKTVRATTRIVFLGILLDGRSKVLCIPEEKKIRALNMLLGVIDRKKATVRELQQLSGYLNFLTKAIFAGRVFTRRMYAKFNDKAGKLKQHHHVRLDNEFKQDCKVWISFLLKNDQSNVCRPMVDLSDWDSTEILDFYSDASGSKKKGGYGCYYDSAWCYGKWSEDLMEKNPSIEYLELAALCFGVFNWSEKLRNRRVRIFCDNDAVCKMVVKNSSSCKNCMVLLRLLTLRSLEFNMRIFTKYVETYNNGIADALSRLNLRRFKKLTRNKPMDLSPTQVTSILWPLTKFWID